MNNNLIFLGEEDLDRNVYRVFNFQRLEEIFHDKELTLVKPKLWDDPFENFILNSTGALPDGRECQIGFRDSFYGQCWSLTKESDAMWRIYSPNKESVKIKTTIRKLFNPIFSREDYNRTQSSSSQRLSSFIGRVKYSSTKKLTAMLEDRERMSNKVFDQTGRGQASTFYFKRWAFRHENEIRIMFNERIDSDQNILKFDVQPHHLVDEIVFDPRLSEEEFVRRKNLVQSWGFNKKIVQSGLYKIKKFRVALYET
ncbi:MAG: DUF2971 domain-containing protein [Bacteroidota bacterium]